MDDCSHVSGVTSMQWHRLRTACMCIRTRGQVRPSTPLPPLTTNPIETSVPRVDQFIKTLHYTHNLTFVHGNQLPRLMDTCNKSAYRIPALSNSRQHVSFPIQDNMFPFQLKTTCFLSNKCFFLGIHGVNLPFFIVQIHYTEHRVFYIWFCGSVRGISYITP